MANLSAARVTDQYGGTVSPIPLRLSAPVADNVHIFEGALVQIDAAGRATPAGTTTTADTHTFKTWGRAFADYDNTVVGHSAGAFTVEISVGAFLYDNSGSDPVAQANVGLTVYAADDHTIAATSNSNVLASAGKLLGFDPVSLQAIVLICPGIV